MKKLAYAIVCSTGLVVMAFAPGIADMLVGAFFAGGFAILCLLTDESNRKP